MFKSKLIVKNINGDNMTKKYIYILLSILLIITIVMNNNIDVIEPTFNEIYDDYNFDNYEIKFDECKLSTDNFINKFSYFNDKDFKILEITPYIKESYINLFDNKQFLFYSNNLYKILDEFKNKYLDIMGDNENYISNICIKKVKINTASTYLKEFKTFF